MTRASSTHFPVIIDIVQEGLGARWAVFSLGRESKLNPALEHSCERNWKRTKEKAAKQMNNKDSMNMTGVT
jgi:hypothetical protein